MDEEIAALEKKVEQLVSLYERARADNHRLRDRLGALEAEHRQQSGKLAEVTSRVEALLSRLPPQTSTPTEN